MGDPLGWHRLQFAFTIVYHYLFPQLTMGLALLIVVFKALALRTKDEEWNEAARFWIKVFGLNFGVGVVTGIPMEFQLGTNWAGFAKYAGGVVGQTLAMEGMFAFFLESTFFGMLLLGEKKLGPRKHFLAAVALFLGSWLSGYFIVTTNAFMQHPVGYRLAENGTLQLADLRAFLGNEWAWVQFAHNQMASLVTSSFVVCAVGAFWMLRGTFLPHARKTLAVGLTAGMIGTVLVAFPTGDRQAKIVAKHQPIAFAAMEGRFESGSMAHLTIIGQPNVPAKRLDNPIHIPGVLSFLAYGTFQGHVKGLDEFPQDEWPTNIELLYYSFHVMAGLGTLMMGLMALGNLQRFRGKLESSRGLLWALLLAFPFPYIATTAGWMAAELGRQPWLIYGLFRTAQGASPKVHSGSTLFTLIGFCGLYLVVGLLYVFLMGREIVHGPSSAGQEPNEPSEGAEVTHG